MSDFDPYYKWLGIPPQEQPPNHYRLLGVQMLEQNAEVIEAAANRQMAYLQELSSGDDHVDEAQRLLGEVARARVCLLAAESKVRYDAELVSTLDSLPEAEEATPESVAAPEFDSADRDAAAPRRPATRRSSGKKRGSTARRSGRRSPPTKNASRSAAREEEEVAAPSESSSLQIKIIAAAAPAVVILVIGIVWMVAGGDSSSKPAAKNDRENKTGSSASPGQGDNKDPLEAARNKNFGNQAGDNGSNRPTKPVVKPPKPDSGPEKSKLNKPPEQPAAAPTKTTADEPSAAELAENLLEEKGLEEGINSTWRLAADLAAYEEIKNASASSSGTAGGATFEAELERRVAAKKKEILDEWSFIRQQQPDNGGPLDQKYNRLAGMVYQGPRGEMLVKDNISEIQSIRSQLESEFTSEGASEVNPALITIINQIRRQYETLKKNSKVQAALETVGGKLAKPPALPEATNPESTQFTSAGSPADDPSNNNSEQDDPSTGSGDKGEQKKPTKPEPTLSYADLKDQLTALEKKTKLSLGSFNKEAKAYVSQKKDLVKRIKAGEALYARRGRQQDAIQYPEEKTKFGQETDAKVTKPLQALKVQLQKLSKPDAAAMEGNLSRAEKLLEQIKTTPEYAANPKSIAGLAETIAKYRKGYEVQQTKMAK